VIILCVLVLCTQVNMMFVMLLWVCIHTGQAEKLPWQRWESNPRPLGYLSIPKHILTFCIKSRFHTCYSMVRSRSWRKQVIRNTRY
jgi:hypothetical protein